MMENGSEVKTMILAGDIGGTKTLLGLFDAVTARPRPVVVRSFGTLDHPDLQTMIAEFLEAEDAADARATHGGVEIACFGVAGPVVDGTVKVTNVPWFVDARRVASALGVARVSLLNDLEALAHAVPVLRESETHVLQEGEAMRGGNIGLIAAGTGLGEALLHNVDGRFLPSASEAGHADFAARTEREITLAREVIRRFGRADVEHVVSGRGLINIHPVAHTQPCAAGVDLDSPDAAAAMSAAAMERRCAGCVETLDMFIEAYGAEAGNLALRSVSTGGLYIGGGIAPKILPMLTNGAFLRAFRAKPPLDPMLSAMPVKVILNAESGLLGAAVFAAGHR
ncbi:MAG: Glucokinase [Acidobacteria bacterium]|nr:Glucokinase [Acidobacteriota bacterium]